MIGIFPKRVRAHGLAIKLVPAGEDVAQGVSNNPKRIGSILARLG